jgi:hypothetical protein
MSDNLLFSVGKAPPPLTKKEKLLKLKKQKEKERIKKQKQANKGKPSLKNIQPFNFKQPIFNILPAHLFHSRVHSALSFTFANPKALYNFVEGWKDSPFGGTPDSWKNGLDGFWSPELRDAIEDAVFLTQHHRFLFRKILHHWRFKRLEKVNTTDILTGEAPGIPVHIIDWKLKRLWSFEATTLMRDITSRLYHHDGFFEEPLSPRNPYTNELLRPSQTISVWCQLSRAGIPVSTPFTSFRAARWNLKRFTAEQSIPLQLFAFRKTMKDLNHVDTYEKIMDFIQVAYNNEAVDCYTQAYSHALRNYHNNELIKRWQHLCLRYYEAEIAFYNNLDKKEVIQNKIWDESVRLLDKQKILVALRNEDLRNTVRARGVTGADIEYPLPIPLLPNTILPFTMLTHIVSELEFTFNL